MKTKNKTNNNLIFVCTVLSLISLVLIFVPSIGYETLATQNFYSFSLWNFVVAIFVPENSGNLIISNYLEMEQTSASAYTLGIGSVLLFISLIIQIVMLIVSNISNSNNHFYISAVSAVLNFVCLISAIVFCDIITNKKSGLQMGTNGFIMWGVIVLTVLNFLVLCILSYIKFFTRKN